MNSQHQERADKVVESFRESLGKDIRDSISENQYQVLSLMICEAIGEELEIAARKMEEVIRNLRAESGKAEIGL